MVKVEIKNCEQCPHHFTKQVYTSDSFENVRAISCKLLNKEVHSYLNWNEESTVPTICPFNLKESPTISTSKWITVDQIKQLVQRKERLYRAGETSLGHHPEPLFNYNLGSFDLDNSDEFNPENWCGGDDIIREYLTEMEGCGSSHDYDLETDKIGFRYIANHDWIDDYQFLSIVVDSYNLYSDSDERITDMYLIKVYKNRGKTESILRNGKAIELNDYVDLLNIIQATGFEFRDIKELKNS